MFRWDWRFLSRKIKLAIRLWLSRRGSLRWGGIRRIGLRRGFWGILPRWLFDNGAPSLIKGRGQARLGLRGRGFD
jgi:hypothetical protein